MVKIGALSAREEILWRALMQIVVSLPRRLDGDMRRTMGISANEYMSLMALSETPGLELRMTCLAKATGLSASRTTRLVDELQGRGLVTKRASAEDRRGNVARLTLAGTAKLEAAWRFHVSSVRELVFDQVDPVATNDVARALSEIATRLEARSK